MIREHVTKCTRLVHLDWCTCFLGYHEPIEKPVDASFGSVVESLLDLAVGPVVAAVYLSPSEVDNGPKKLFTCMPL